MSDDRPTSIPKEQIMLMELVALAAPKELPKNFLENHSRIWAAFNLGKEYEKEVTRQCLTGQNEKV